MSDQLKHTPGPWPLETVKTSVGICHKIGQFPAPHSHRPITCACVYNDGYPDPNRPGTWNPELWANARLMAAAPELLHACFVVKQFLDALELATDENDPLTALRRSVHAPMQVALRQAIDKATGANE